MGKGRGIGGNHFRLLIATTNRAGIHHKTSAGGGAYGYPDDTYLDRVIDELKGFGVTEADIA